MTLGGQPQWLETSAYNVTFCDANGTRKDRPNGGLYISETDKANTLSTSGNSECMVTTARMTAFGEYAEDGTASTLKQRDYKDATDLVYSCEPKITAREGKESRINVEHVGTLRKEMGDNHPIVWHNHQQDGSIRMQNDISPTVSKHWGTDGNNVPFVGVRRLTPMECERLQGFPDLWTGEQADTQRYKQLGNAVTVNVAEWIGKRIISSSQGL